MLGMVLGVASLITVMSVMNGFAEELNARILALVPHGTITASSGQIKDWQSLAETVAVQPDVVGVAPVIDDTVLMGAWGQQRGVTVSGIDLTAQRSVNTLHQHVVSGALSALEIEPFTVVLGTTLARILGVGPGDAVDVTLPTVSVTPLGILPRNRALKVVGVFEVGTDLDATQAWVSLDTARRLFTRAGVDGLQLQFSSLARARAGLDELANRLPGHLTITDWRTSQGSLFTAVQMEKITIGVLLMAVIAVAAFNIVSTLTMSVTEKQGDIAVLRVLGLSSRAILWLFIGHGVLLGVLGIAVGTVLGVSLSLWISELAVWLEGLAGQPLFDPQVYYIGRLPSVLRGSDVLITVFGALGLSLLATLYPSWRAARIQPVEALNNG